MINEIRAVGPVSQDRACLSGEVSDEGKLGHEALNHCPKNPRWGDVEGKGDSNEHRIDGDLACVIGGNDVGMILYILGAKHPNPKIRTVERKKNPEGFFTEI